MYCTVLYCTVLYCTSSEGGGWSQVAEVGAGDRKTKIGGLTSGDK